MELSVAQVGNQEIILNTFFLHASYLPGNPVLPLPPLTFSRILLTTGLLYLCLHTHQIPTSSYFPYYPPPISPSQWQKNHLPQMQKLTRPPLRWKSQQCGNISRIKPSSLAWHLRPSINLQGSLSCLPYFHHAKTGT